MLVGPETGDDAGVYLLDGRALVATADFIMPVCDDPRRFGRVAAANSLSDLYAMGATPLFALNLCAFPAAVPEEALREILAGAAEQLDAAGAALLGGHSVRDEELKFGLAAVGVAAPDRLLTNAGARAGDRLLLTKPLGTGVIVNAFKAGKLDEPGLEPVLVEMERLNAVAAQAAITRGARAAVDVTGFGLAGHALGLARASGVALRLELARLPVHEAFPGLVRAGVSTGCTGANRSHAEPALAIHTALAPWQRELLFDPQTSGGLLVATPREAAEALLTDLLESGHRAAVIGEVVAGDAAIEIC